MALNPEHQSSFLGYGSLVGALIIAHVLVLGFWFVQLAKGTPSVPQESKKDQ